MILNHVDIKLDEMRHELDRLRTVGTIGLGF